MPDRSSGASRMRSARPRNCHNPAPLTANFRASMTLTGKIDTSEREAMIRGNLDLERAFRDPVYRRRALAFLHDGAKATSRSMRAQKPDLLSLYPATSSRKRPARSRFSSA